MRTGSVPRTYGPMSSINVPQHLQEDDPGIMSEAETSATGRWTAGRGRNAVVRPHNGYFGGSLGAHILFDACEMADKHGRPVSERKKRLIMNA